MQPRVTDRGSVLEKELNQTNPAPRRHGRSPVAAARLAALFTDSSNGYEGLTKRSKESRAIKYSLGKRGLCHT